MGVKALLPLLAIILSTAPSGAAAQHRSEVEVIPYHCGELAVIGRFKNLSYEGVDIEDDLLGHGWMIARFHVRRTLRGRWRDRALTVRYFGHSYYREDRDFMLALALRDDGTYSIRRMRLLGGGRRWRLASACDARPPA